MNPEKSDVKCPNCKPPYDDRVYRYTTGPTSPGPTKNFYRCESCGGQTKDLETTEAFIRSCANCFQVVEKLHGLFVPHLCEVCYHNLQKDQRATGQVCRLCGHCYIDCCC